MTPTKRLISFNKEDENIISSRISGVPDPYMNMLDRAGRLAPLPKMMPEPDPLSSVLSHQKSIIDKYARDKQKLKGKMEKNLEMLWNNYKDDEKKRKMQSGNECNQDATMPVHVRTICFICETWLRPACKHLYVCSRCETMSGPCPSCLNTDGNARFSKNTGVPTTTEPPRSNLDILDRAARLPPLPDILETDPLSFVLSQQKSIIDKYALKKQKLKVKMENNLASLWNNYKNNERNMKMQSGEECSPDAAMTNASMSCFICDTSLRPACEHMCLCSSCDNKPRTCPYCLTFDGSS